MRPAHSSLRTIVLAAFFAALTVVGTSIRVPMPAAIGNPFVHLGNSVVLLAILLLGFFYGSLAGGLGFFIFDLLNGYAVEAPYFLIEAFIVGAAATAAVRLFHGQLTSMPKVILVALVASLAKLIMTFLKGLVTALLAGTSANAALLAALNTLFPTIINCLTTIIVVSLLYFPLANLLKRRFA